MKIKNSKYVIPIIMIALMLSFAPLAESSPIGSRAELPSGMTTLNFEGLEPGTVIADQFAGLTFAGGAISFYPGGAGRVMSTTPGRNAGIVAVFDASLNITTVGVDYTSYSPLLTLEAYNASQQLIEAVSVASNIGFLGLTVSESIYTVKIHDSGFAFDIDNFSFGPTSAASGVSVPEANTLMLLGGGLLGLGIFKKKFKL